MCDVLVYAGTAYETTIVPRRRGARLGSIARDEPLVAQVNRTTALNSGMRDVGFGDDADSRSLDLKTKGRDVRVGDEYSFDELEPPHENSDIRFYWYWLGGLRRRALTACLTPARRGTGGDAFCAAADW